MKAGKGRRKCTWIVAAVLSALTLFGAFACGKETESVGIAQPTTEPAKSGQTATSRPVIGPSAEKVAFEEAEKQREEAAQNATRAPKFPEPSQVISCPTDAAKIAPGIFPYDPKFPPPPIWHQGTLINIATVVSSGGVPYLIYAGAGNDPQQGIIVVEEQPTDVCALTAGIVPPPPEPKWYQTPSKAGVVTLSQIEGDAVVFTTADGATGRFDYTKGEFSAQPAAP